jgi:hypothetical protein
VKSDTTGEPRKDPNGTPIRYVLKNLQLIDDDVQSAPKSGVVADTDTVGTRGTKAAAAAAELEAEADAQPEPLAKEKATPTPTPTPDTDVLIGKKVKSFIDFKSKEYQITGEVVGKTYRKKNNKRQAFYEVAWDKKHKGKWAYRQTEYLKKGAVLKLI